MASCVSPTPAHTFMNLISEVPYMTPDPPSVSQTKETALHWASTVGLWNDILGYICTLCRQVAPMYFLEVPSIKMQKHSLHNCLLES